MTNLEMIRMEVMKEHCVGEIEKTENGNYDCFWSWENKKDVQYIMDTKGRIHRFEY